MSNTKKFFESNIKNDDDQKLFDSIDKSKKIKNYLDTLSNSTTTKDSYKRAIYRLFFYNKIDDPDKYLINPDSLKNSKRIEFKEQWKNLILRHSNFLSDTLKLAPKGIHGDIAGIRGLLDYYEIFIPKNIYLKISKTKGTKAVSEKETPSQKILSEILSHTDLEGKAMFVLQAVTGSRIDEIVSLSMDDLDLTKELGRIRIQYFDSKNKQPVSKFVSPECKEILLEYLKDRENKLKGRANRTKNNKYLTEKRLFPMTVSNANLKWLGALKKSGYYRQDNVTGLATMTTHCLRRYFFNQFRKYDVNIAKVFTNQISDLDKTYRYMPIEELENHYYNAIKFLLIFKTPADVDKEVQKLVEENKELKNKVSLIEELDREKQMKFNNMENTISEQKRKSEIQEKLLGQLIDRIDNLTRETNKNILGREKADPKKLVETFVIQEKIKKDKK